MGAIVGATIPALMARDHIPGMAVGIAVGGTSYVFTYGVASKEPRRPVTSETLFELGSVSKTFTATLVSLAQIRHRLSLAEPTETYLPALRGTAFGKTELLNLGTHTLGGIPLQVPGQVTGRASLMRYLRAWRPSCTIGTCRTYSNIGIGVLGLIAADRMGETFPSIMQRQLFPALGLKHTFLTIPAKEMAHYAWGYTGLEKPIRLNAGMLADETYGIRTTAGDMIHFLQENIDPSGLPSDVREAIVQTHTGYFIAGPMTQDLVWEQYRYPVTLTSLQAGNSYHMIFDATPVRAIRPPRPPQRQALLNKTGSTNGFGTYVAFIPSQRLAIVLLANRNYAIPDRVAAAYRILRALSAR